MEVRHTLALELEYAFRRCGIPEEKVNADSICIEPTETIRDAFGYLFADGVLSQKDKSWLYEKYDFGDKKLNGFDNSEIENFKELIEQINAFAKKREEELDL